MGDNVLSNWVTVVNKQGEVKIYAMWCELLVLCELDVLLIKPDISTVLSNI